MFGRVSFRTSILGSNRVLVYSPVVCVEHDTEKSSGFFNWTVEWCRELCRTAVKMIDDVQKADWWLLIWEK